MKLKSARFKNLIGIYRASDLEEIYIDFTKSLNNIILIVGPNGSGKSTIMDALHPLPDSQSMYIEGREGLKEIEYIDDNIVYRVRIIYPITNTRTRATTKAFLTQITPDGEEIDYNPNGNIGSYKDELYAKFNLDPNFVSLSQLSVDDKGIVSKTPSERKKFTTNILESVEVYNNIYKALSKRSTIFKSMINSITAKIDTIGDEAKINSDISSIQNRLTRLLTRKDKLIKDLSDNEANIRLIDPDGSIQNLYTNLYNELLAVDDKLSVNKIIINNSGYKNINDLLTECNNTKDSVNDLKNYIDNKKDYIRTLLASREEDTKLLQLKNQRLESLTSKYSYENLKSKIETLKNNQNEYIKIFNEIGIENFNITKDEYILGLNTLKELKDMVDLIRSYATNLQIELALEYIHEKSDIIGNINKYTDKVNIVKQKISDLREKYKYYQGMLRTLDILEERPSECKINNCPFIKDAYDINQLNPRQKMKEISVLIDEYIEELNNDEKQLSHFVEINKIIQSINIIIRSIASNSFILSKLPNGYIFGNIDIFLNNLQKGSTFNEINDIYKYLDYANIFELYKNEKDILIKLESEFKIYESKNDIIEEISTDIDNLVDKLSTITKDIGDINIDIQNKSKDLSCRYDKLTNLNKLLEKYTLYNDLLSQKKDIESKINIVSSNMSIIESSINNINNINNELGSINTEIQPLSDNKDNLSYSLSKLKEYQNELNEYNDTYRYIEIIKKYSAPTKGGIQTLFMKLYMGKTLKMANELLSLLFDGRLELLQYVINENEFRIPCKSASSPIINDDISSCSSAEKSMISMIISFSLLQQSSTKYNILKLDELDGALDQSNRSNFIVVLKTIMDMLKVENCILVSHSAELDLSSVDIINLDKNNTNMEGNIIFSYINT